MRGVYAIHLYMNVFTKAVGGAVVGCVVGVDYVDCVDHVLWTMCSVVDYFTILQKKMLSHP